jgi:hypothetical protein
MYGYQGSATTGTMHDQMHRDSTTNGMMNKPMNGDAVKK